MPSLRRAEGGVGFWLEGDKALQALLEKLPAHVFQKVVRPATSKAMTPIARDMRNRVRSTSPAVAKAIGKKSKSYRRRYTFVTVAGVRHGAQFEKAEKTEGGGTRKVVPSKIAHLIEYGTKAHKIPALLIPETGEIARREWLHPGATEKPFIRPAWDSGKGGIASRMKYEIGRGIVRLAKRMATKGGDSSLLGMASDAGLDVD